MICRSTKIEMKYTSIDGYDARNCLIVNKLLLRKGLINIVITAFKLTERIDQHDFCQDLKIKSWERRPRYLEAVLMQRSWLDGLHCTWNQRLLHLFSILYFLYMCLWKQQTTFYSANAKTKSIRATNIARNRTSFLIDEFGNFFYSTRTVGPPLSPKDCRRHVIMPVLTSVLGGNLYELALRALPLPVDWS